ncbi:type II toxin-antitoxin system VapC family toxin [Haloferula sp. A504]|uniref:type II toxin-antitoxin system VapC family toxin n=1 Tax=Haloferula sp. A504 TaxID=3373601 RepID=UPI0031C6BA09|nr:type II toxin-antitoxin system VapC family toxin [Verrucomicrobiaceae bacterium E54]
MLALDTDHLTELGYATAPGKRLATRLAEADGEVAITIISVEEQMRGWLAKIAGAKAVTEQTRAYAALGQRVNFLAGFDQLPWDRGAASRFERFRKSGIRIGTLDLRIACIAIERGALLLTRNSVDFEKVPGLRFENWLD